MKRRMPGTKERIIVGVIFAVVIGLVMLVKNIL